MNSKSLPQKRILVVEDSPEIREALSELLSMESYQVTLAPEGRAALDYLRSAEPLPEVILLDLLMPGLDGYGFLKEQKADSRISGIPVLIMTANQTQDAQALGTAGFVRKPIAIEVLLTVLDDALKKSH